jgi:hypothetical protein
VLGFADEVWWSRLARPALHARGEGPVRLVGREPDRTDPDPAAVACYGLLRRDTGGMMLRFVAGRPVSRGTTAFLARACDALRREGKRALRLVWDNASWHVSREVRAWVRSHDRAARAAGGVRTRVEQHLRYHVRRGRFGLAPQTEHPVNRPKYGPRRNREERAGSSPFGRTDLSRPQNSPLSETAPPLSVHRNTLPVMAVEHENPGPLRSGVLR